MSDIDLAELKRLAEGANTAATWYEAEDIREWLVVAGMTLGADEDAAYIAAASPDVVVALVERVEAAEAAVERAWSEGHAAGRDYAGDGWNGDAHDPQEDNPYRRDA